MSSVHPVFKAYPSCLRETLIKFNDLSLLDRVEKQVGKISVNLKDMNQEANWNWKDNEISLSSSYIKNANIENISSLVLFELCNACKTNDFIALKNKEYGVEDYVRSFEKLEHDSALEVGGYMVKLFGTDVSFPHENVFEDFPTHYLVQQLSGHSENIAKKAFPLQEFRGTWGRSSLCAISDLERKVLLLVLNCLLSIKKKREIQKNYEHLDKVLQMVTLKNFPENFERIKTCVDLILKEHLSSLSTFRGSGHLMPTV